MFNYIKIRNKEKVGDSEIGERQREGERERELDYGYILNLFRTLSSWGIGNYRPSVPLLDEVASHVKQLE